MLKYSLVILVFFLLIYIGGTDTLVRKHQADVVLVASILACTLSMWGAWYAFLLKKTSLCASILALLFYSLWLVYLAAVEMINPKLM